MIRLNMIRQCLPFLMKLGPPKLLRKLAECLPSENVQKMIGIVDTMADTAETIYRQKTAVLQEENNQASVQHDERKDILSVLRASSLKSERLRSFTDS